MPKRKKINQKNVLENIVSTIQYEDLGIWRKDDSINFSHKKKLFDYQISAVQNITKILHLYFDKEHGDERLLQAYQTQGCTIQAHEQINRICLWMATGSGKSLVIIKTIELLDYLQSQNLIPHRDILFLPPREDLINQFKKEVEDYNRDKREKCIELLPLTEYENEDAGILPQGYNITVYYCLSHLLKEEHKQNQLDYKSFLNYGKWYVFLDEAHRGESDESLLKKYVNKLSENGFLFNFSATFTDAIDHISTGYNFNLEKFINDGFGKNIYLSKSYFNDQKHKDDFTEQEKQKQVLKSLITFTLIKKSKKNPSTYHHPLMLTLVNTVNKTTKEKDPDLLMFFEKLEEIAENSVSKKILDAAKKDLIDEFNGDIKNQFNDEKIKIDSRSIQDITIEDILHNVFNTDTFGKFEYIEGAVGKEIILKIQTSETPFALIRIGDTQPFIKNYLSGNYEVIKNYRGKQYFGSINEDNEINLLMGSRAFYEGWDSNRPNVMNFINIGKGKRENEKFVPQAIGRGIRIEPKQNMRKRLPIGDKDKNPLLETLVIFSTDVNSLQAILDNIDNEKVESDSVLVLQENERIFDLLLPVYKEAESSGERFAKFNISQNSLENFNVYYSQMSKETLLLNTSLGINNLNLFEAEKEKNNFFQITTKPENDYQDMKYLLQRIIRHVSLKNPEVKEIKILEDEIVHFKQIKVSNLNDIEKDKLKADIDSVSKYEHRALTPDEEKAIDLLKESNLGYFVEHRASICDFKDLCVTKIAQHYYVPLIYSNDEKIDYIKHIIRHPSEVNFIKQLIKHINENRYDFKWMFSKIDESLDKQVYIPYFYKTDNWYRNFYPDFIFWIKNNNNYKIVYIDPKSAKYADHLDKIDGFDSIFREGDKPKIFKYKNYRITFDFKLISDNVNNVSGERYQQYWQSETDFKFLSIT